MGQTDPGDRSGAEDGAKKDSFLIVFRRDAVMVMCRGADERMIVWGVTVLNSGWSLGWPLGSNRQLKLGTAGRREVEGVPSGCL